MNIDSYTTKGEALNCSDKEQEANAYLDGLDIADSYRRIVSCSLSQSQNTGGVQTSQTRTLGAPSRTLYNRPRLNRSNASSRTYGPNYFTRAGQGYKGTHHCGEIISIGACQNKDCHQSLPLVIKATCHRYDCPECYHSANERMAKEASDRIIQFEKDWIAEFGEKPGKLKHVIISPNPKLWDRQRMISDAGKSFDRQVKKVLDHASRGGFYAFEGLLHLEREKHKDGSDCPGKSCTVPTEDHIWQWGPHIHLVGYAYLMDPEQLHEEFPGWNIKVIPEAKGEHRDAYGTLLYQGSHASIIYNATTHRQSRKAVKHLGLSNPATYRRKLEEVKVEAKKCTCGQPIKVFMPTKDNQPDRSFDYGPLYEKRPVYSYTFRQSTITKFFRDRPAKLERWNQDRARFLRKRFAQAFPSNDLTHGGDNH